MIDVTMKIMSQPSIDYLISTTFTENSPGLSHEGVLHEHLFNNRRDIKVKKVIHTFRNDPINISHICYCTSKKLHS